MFLFQQFLPGLLVAALLSGALLGISAWGWKGNAWGAAAALGAGYIGGHVMVAGWPHLPPSEATQWLVWFAVITPLAAVLDAALRPRAQVRGWLWAIGCAGLLALLLLPKFHHEWTVPRGLLWVAGLSAGVVLLSWCLEQVEQRQASPMTLPLLLTIIAAGTSAALILSGSMLLSHFAGGLAAALGAIFAFTFLPPRMRLPGRGLVPVAAVLLVGLWSSGYFYAELPAASALLLALAPAIGLFMSRGNRDSVLIQAVTASALVLVAVLIAFRASPPLW